MAKYWVGGSGNWSQSAHWATNSGGTGNTGVPTSTDNVFFDTLSGNATVNVDVIANCANLNFTGFSGTLTSALTGVININGSLNMGNTIKAFSANSGPTLNFVNTLTPVTLQSNGQTVGNINIICTGSSVTLLDDLVGLPTSILSLSAGTFDANGKNVVIGGFLSPGFTTRTVSMGSGTWSLCYVGSPLSVSTGIPSLTYGETVWDTTSKTNLTVNSGTSKIRLIHSAGIGGLSTDIDQYTTTITVLNSSNISSAVKGPGPYNLLIDDELITYTTLTNNVFSGCTRGSYATASSIHSSGTAVLLIQPEVTYLSANIDSSATSVTVDTAALLPSSGVVSVNNEQINLASQNASTLTISRGFNGTTATSHSAGESVISIRRRNFKGGGFAFNNLELVHSGEIEQNYIYGSNSFANISTKLLNIAPFIASTFAGSGDSGNLNGTGIASSFNLPYSLVTDKSGNIYVSDVGNNLIRKITPAGVVTTFAGSGDSGNIDGIGTAASFSLPTGVAIDNSGTIYIADTGNNSIRMITSDRIVTTLAGSGNPGNTDGIGTAASFTTPTGLAFDDLEGCLYVADTGNNSIRRITITPKFLEPEGTVVTIAGTGNPGITSDFNYANLTITTATFNAPSGIAVVPSKFANSGIYVADTNNNLIRRIVGGVVSTYVGLIDTIYSYPLDYVGHAGSADGTSTVASFYSPTGITVDSNGDLYVTDRTTNLIRKITTDIEGNPIVSTIAGIVDTMGNTNAKLSTSTFSNPTGIAVGANDDLYIADQSNNLIRIITRYQNQELYFESGQTNTFNSWLISGKANALFKVSSITTGSQATLNLLPFNQLPLFFGPRGIATDSSGNIYVADSNNSLIRKVTSAGVVSTLAGAVGTTEWADGTGADAYFNNPYSVATDNIGNVYVADINNHVIRKVTPAGVVTTFAGTPGVSGNTNGTTSTALLNRPSGIAIDGSGNFYIADTANNQIRKITPSGTVTTLAGSGDPGSTDGIGAAASFNGPSGITVTNTGTVYVADFNNYLIRKITPDGSVKTIAGQAGIFGNTNGTGTNALFNIPSGIAVDKSNNNNIFVADTGNQLIRKIVDSNNTVIVTTFAGSGSPVVADGTGTSASFSDPAGITTDISGNVYVSDSAGYTIRKITPLGAVTTLAGQAGVSGYYDTNNINQYWYVGANSRDISNNTNLVIDSPKNSSTASISISIGLGYDNVYVDSIIPNTVDLLSFSDINGSPSFALPPPSGPSVVQIADGYTPPYTSPTPTVDTGVGGQNFSKNVTAGNTLDVIFMAHASSGHSCVISKASGTATIGTPIQIDHIDDTAPTSNQYTEIYRFLVPITGSGSLSIRATYGNPNEQVMIAAAEISGGTINGYVVNNNVGSPNIGGTISSGLITPNTNSGILCGWAAMANPGPPAKTSPTAGGGSTLFASSLFTGFNSGLSYETQVLSSSTQVETVFTSAQAYERTYVLGAFLSNQPVTTINNVNGNNIITSTQIGVAINGIVLSTGTVDIVQGLAVVPQTVTSVTASKITFDVVFDTGSQFDLFYGAATLRVTIGNSIINQGIIIAPPSNKSYFNIGTVNPISSARLSTSPDLQAGDQIEISSVGGTGVTLSDVNINTDGSFDVSSGVTQFSYRVWSIADLVWGSYAVETVSSTSRRRILIIT